MTVREIYDGSDGEATKALYARLEALGPMGIVALNLFRAQKCSTRAKAYRRRAYKSEAYDRKNWSLGNLLSALNQHSRRWSDCPSGIKIWGWKEDPQQSFHKWVLYVEIPTGQVSFHSSVRFDGPDYAAEWDRTHASAQRIVNWCEDLLGEPRSRFDSSLAKPPLHFSQTTISDSIATEQSNLSL